MPTQNLLTGDVILERDGRIIWRDVPLGIDLAHLIRVSSDPNGLIEAPLGSIAVGPGGPWVNTDGAFAWTGIGASSVVVPPGTPAVIIPPGTNLVLLDTTLGSPIVYLPPVSAGAQITFRIVAGVLPAQLTPVGTNGVNGTMFAVYVLDPLVDVSASFAGDATANGTWWLVSTT
jgi:hypothetical protein